MPEEILTDSSRSLQASFHGPGNTIRGRDEEECMHRFLTSVIAAVAILAIMRAPAVAAESDAERAELAKALASAKVSLTSGLSAAATAGKPISAKFETEDGKLQLSVYAEKDGKFSEVVVDPVTG